VPPIPPALVPALDPSKQGALTRFERVMRYVLVNEDGKDYAHDRGTFTNNPKDPGGATMWGVIKTEYEQFLGRTLTVEEVSQQTRETAMAIYRKYFWDVIHGDDYLSDAQATAIMDTAVNKGIGGCMTVLHDALENTNFHYYSEVVLLLKKIDARTFVLLFEPALERYINHRIEKYPNMTWARAGWTNRAKRLLALDGRA
jgi:hypothetical protein